MIIKLFVNHLLKQPRYNGVVRAHEFFKGGSMSDVSFVPFDFAAFTAKYKHQILGKTDVTYSNVANSLPDDWRAALVKDRRVHMARQQQDIALSSGDDNTKAILTSLTTMAFAKSTVRDLQAIILTANPSTITAATSNLINDVSAAISHFKAAGGDTDTRKSQFYADARDILGRLKAMLFIEDGALLAKGTYFSADIFNARKIVASTISTLNISA